MNVKEAIISRRTVRSFSQEAIETETLTAICETSRLYASGANLQPIRLKIVNNKELCAKIFPHTRWAGYTPDYEILPENQPAAYIMLLADREVSQNPQFDAGAISTNMMLLAKEYGLDTCCIGSFDRKDVSDILQIDTEKYQPLYLIAFGKGTQDNQTEPVSEGIKYRYEDGRFIVPKYNLSDIILK